jgi:hypothetical protein
LRAEIAQTTDDKRKAAIGARLDELGQRNFGHFDVTQCDELFAHMRRADTWATPTLVVFEPDTRELAQLLADPRLRFIPSATRAVWIDEARASHAQSDAAQVAQMFTIRLQIVAAMQNAGSGSLPAPTSSTRSRFQASPCTTSCRYSSAPASRRQKHCGPRRSIRRARSG